MNLWSWLHCPVCMSWPADLCAASSREAAQPARAQASLLSVPFPPFSCSDPQASLCRADPTTLNNDPFSEHRKFSRSFPSMSEPLGTTAITSDLSGNVGHS